MAEWTQILDEDDATIDFGGLEIDIYSLGTGELMAQPKVVGVELGIPHYAARCQGCDWMNLDYHNRRFVLKKIRKHVLETGHRVRVERGVIIEFRLEDMTP